LSPEAEAELETARGDLSDAKKLAEIGLTKISARSAYYAAFHAAEAFIFERINKAVKTHSGVRTELARLLKDTPGAREVLPAFLARSYRFKEISDYGKPDDVVSETDMRGAIEGAERFIEDIVNLLAK
jgi:uncharacterized protein (UPF0332 family)